jgi:hypothetical protein
MLIHEILVLVHDVIKECTVDGGEILLIIFSAKGDEVAQSV